MEAKELRIGNYLKTDRECQDDYVEVVEIYNENYFCTCSAGLNYQKEHVKPIPLTEKWLLKFGYEDLIDMAISFCKQSEYYGVEITSEDLRKIKVHEAQNLYYALTKKELTIKK